MELKKSGTGPVSEEAPDGRWKTELPGEDRLRLLIENSTDIITLLDPRGTILYQSSSLERMLGHKLQERIYKNLFESPLLHPEDADRMHAFVADALRHPAERVSAEFRLRHVDGTYRWFEAVGRNLLGEPGLRGILANYRDITDWKRAQEELAERTRLSQLGADIAAAIAGCGDLRTMLQRCAAIVLQQLEAAFVGIWTLDEGWQVLVLRASAGTGVQADTTRSRIPVGMYDIGLIAQQRQPQLVNRLGNDLRSREHGWAAREGMVAFAGHPLIVENRLVGVVALFARCPLPDNTLEVLGTVSDRIASGIDRKRVEHELRRSLDSLLVLHESGRILGSSLQLDELGPALVGIARRVAGVDTAVLSLWGDDGEQAVYYAEGPEELWGRVRDTDTARAAYLRASQRGELEGFRVDLPGAVASRVAGWCLPLVAHGETIGMLEAYGPPSLEAEEAVELLQSVASQAANALENARLYEALAERERRLEQLVGKLITAQEEERRRVAYEVHDGLAQTATAAHQHLQTYAHSHRPRSPRARSELERIVDLVRQTVGDARRVIADLRPTELDDFGLGAAIRRQLDALHSLGWRVSLEENLGGERLDPMVETALLRVAQEALRNVHKHSGTDRVQVSLDRGASSVRLEVRDCGRGFEPDRLTAGSGPGERVGLEGMRERIKLLGGVLRIQSEPGRGTSVKAEVPLTRKEGADG